jgi:hypothetical protein
MAHMVERLMEALGYGPGRAETVTREAIMGDEREPMSEERLEEIEVLAEMEAMPIHNANIGYCQGLLKLLTSDVPDLLAEVRRLREREAALAAVRSIAEEWAAYAENDDSWNGNAGDVRDAASTNATRWCGQRILDALADALREVRDEAQ